MENLKSTFVSESEIEEAKKRRQEEWEKVRRPDQPKEAPEEPQDLRPLYERLREQRDKAQAEFEESIRIRHMVRGLDDEEAGFLDQVDKIRAEEDLKRRLEERELLDEYKQALTTTVDQPLQAAVVDGPKTTPPGGSKPRAPSKQAQLLGAAIRRRTTSNDGAAASTASGEPPEKRGKVVHDASAINHTAVGKLPTAMHCVAILPGVNAYGRQYSSDSNSSSDTNSDPDDFVLPATKRAQDMAITQGQANAGKSKHAGTCGNGETHSCSHNH